MARFLGTRIDLQGIIQVHLFSSVPCFQLSPVFNASTSGSVLGAACVQLMNRYGNSREVLQVVCSDIRKELHDGSLPCIFTRSLISFQVMKKPDARCSGDTDIIQHLQDRLDQNNTKCCGPRGRRDAFLPGDEVECGGGNGEGSPAVHHSLMRHRSAEQQICSSELLHPATTSENRRESLLIMSSHGVRTYIRCRGNDNARQ